MSAYKILANVILEGVAYETGNVIELGFLADETRDNLLERNIIEASSDEVTATHGAQPQGDTVKAPVSAEVPTDEPPLEGQPAVDGSGTVPTPAGTTAEQIQKDLEATTVSSTLPDAQHEV